jgi:hypothetical protein
MAQGERSVPIDDDELTRQRIRDAVETLLDLAVCWELRDAASDPRADKSLTEVVAILERHRENQLDLGRSGVIYQMTGDLAEIYRTQKDKADTTALEQEAQLCELFRTQGIELTDEGLTELVLMSDEVTAEGGPVDAAARGIAKILGVDRKTVFNRIKASRTQGLLGPAMTGWGRRAGPAAMIRYALAAFSVTEDGVRGVLGSWAAGLASSAAVPSSCVVPHRRATPERGSRFRTEDAVRIPEANVASVPKAPHHRDGD